MRITTRYLSSQIIRYFLIFVALFVAVLLIYELFDSRNKFLEYNPPLVIIVQYLLCSAPAQMADMMPMIGLMSTIFAYGLLAKNREILAMVAAGISFRQLAAPALFFGFFLSVFLFGFNEYVVPAAQTQATYLAKVVIPGQDDSVFTKREDLFVRGDGNRFYAMKEYFSNRHQMIYPTILVLADDGSHVNERIDADLGRMAGDTWEFLNARRWTFKADGTVDHYEKFTAPYRMKMEDKLDKFLSKTKKPEEMNYAELREYRDLLLRKNDENVARYSLDLDHKVSFPFACLLMGLLGFAVVSDVHARHFRSGVFIGLIVSIAFYILDSLMRKLGGESSLPPTLAAWGPIAIFAAAVYMLMYRIERIRY